MLKSRPEYKLYRGFLYVHTPTAIHNHVFKQPARRERKGDYLMKNIQYRTFLLTDLIRSAAVKEGGVLTIGAVVLCPPWGDGSCEVEATSPTATQVEQEREAWSSRGWSSRYPDLCTELRANSETAHRGGG